MLAHARHGVGVVEALIAARSTLQHRGQRHGDVALKHHDRQLIAIGMGYTRRIDDDAGGLHPDAGLRRRVAQEELQELLLVNIF